MPNSTLITQGGRVKRQTEDWPADRMTGKIRGMDGVGSNLIAELIASLILLVVGSAITIAAMRFQFVRKFLRKLGVNIKLSRPQLDLDLEYDAKSDTTEVIIKNAGDQAAFNVYCYLFEIFHASEGGDFKVSSLGVEKIRAGILAPGEKVIFKGKHIQFDGCNVTAEQEIWVEYTDEIDQHYRTRIIPPTPRGDDLKVEPPLIIQHRMPRLPGLSYPGKGSYEAIRKGQEGLRGIKYQ